MRFILFILLVSCSGKKATSASIDESFYIQSTYTKDRYQINVNKPELYDSLKYYTIVYVADGSIGLGEYAVASNGNWKAAIPKNCIIVTIGHEGDWKAKRRRDFIPSDITKNSDDEFGRADAFYLFLKEELLPAIQPKFLHSKTKVFIGHSFSGLFALYAALQNEKLFDKYFAISPSVWANYHELIKLEEQYSKTHKELQADIHIYVGSLEVFNKVISSSTAFFNNLSSRGYNGCKISFEEITAANHFSVRKPAIDRIYKLIGE